MLTLPERIDRYDAKQRKLLLKRRFPNVPQALHIVAIKASDQIDALSTKDTFNTHDVKQLTDLVSLLLLCQRKAPAKNSKKANVFNWENMNDDGGDEEAILTLDDSKDNDTVAAIPTVAASTGNKGT